MKLQPAASPETILAATSVATRQLPDDYIAFLRASDGAEGWIGENYLQIFSARSAAETTLGFAPFVPGLFFFGGDGAEALFAFDLRGDGRGVVITHTDDMDLNGLVAVADSLTEFRIFLEDNDWTDFWFEQRSRASSLGA